MYMHDVSAAESYPQIQCTCFNERREKEGRKKEASKVKQTNKAKKHSTPKACTCSNAIYMVAKPGELRSCTCGLSPTQGSSIILGKVTALGVLCCFALLFV